jgi:hypothetical protein
VKLSQLNACDVPMMIPDAVISAQGVHGMIEEIIASHRSDSPFLIKITWRNGAASFPLFPFECDRIEVDLSACDILLPNLSIESPLVRFMNYRQAFNAVARTGDAREVVELLGPPDEALFPKRQTLTLAEGIGLVFEDVGGAWHLVTMELDDNSADLWDMDICSVHAGLEACPERRVKAFDALLKLKSWPPMVAALGRL